MVKKIIGISLKFAEILLIVKAVLIGYEAFIGALPSDEKDKGTRGAVTPK